MEWSNSSSLSDSGYTPHLQSPLSPNYADSDLADLSLLQTYRNVYMLHQFPLEVREPMECHEATINSNLAEQAFFWAAIAFGARGSGDFDNGKTYMRKAECVAHT
jgi:hypothetical protein